MTYDIIPSADNTLSKGPYEIKLIGRTPSQPIYTYQENEIEGKTRLTFIKKYSSSRACVADLDGNRKKNTATLKLRIKHGTLYHGLRVSFSPLTDS